MSWMRWAAIGLGTVSVALAGCSASTGGNGAGSVQPGPSSGPVSRASLPRASSAPVSAPSKPVITSSSAPPQRPIDVIDVQALDSDSTSYRMSLWAQDQLSDCAEHSYGALVAYFRAHPCRHASRYLWTMTFHGRELALSIISVVAAAGAEPDIYKYAGEFSRLENADGTGSINDLLREGQRIPGVTATRIPSNEVFQVVGQDDGVSVFDAWYVTGGTDSGDRDVKQLEQSLFLTDASNFHY